MHIRAKAIIGLAGFAATAQAASACDLEGLGFTRMNPFAQHAAWGVPADQSTLRADQRKDTRQDTAAADAAAEKQQANADQGSQNTARTGLTPVSAEAAARQSQRFTATKD